MDISGFFDTWHPNYYKKAKTISVQGYFKFKYRYKGADSYAYQVSGRDKV